MDSFKDVLEAAQAYCKTQMAEPTYNLYIDGLEPISFEDSSHITLSVRNDFICKIVTDRYLGLLKEAFKTVLGFDVDITLVVPSTPPHEVVLAQQYEANPASPQGNYEFTFENFIKGPSNQFAFAAAQAVAANPSGAYNPLFIYGGSGLGKTHLLTAIQTEIKRTHPDFVIMYVTCEQFTNELIAAIRAGSTEDFRMKTAWQTCCWWTISSSSRARSPRRKSSSTPSTPCTTPTSRSSSRPTAPPRRSRVWKSVCAPASSGA